jgi:DNA-binding transcriptional LysR family regulator
VSNQNVDFVRDGHDLAIRMGTIADATLVARRLGDFALGVYASSVYLARAGIPRSPADLAVHECIGFVMPRSGRILPWTFHPAPRSFVPAAAYRCSDDVLGALGLARAGVGLVQAYDFLVEDDVARGTLVEVLAPFRGATRPFSLIHPKAVPLSSAARALKDFVIEREVRRIKR